MQRQRPGQPTARERLRLTLESPATPACVKQLASMFEETSRQIDPDLVEGAVTMVVENFQLAVELRGWQDTGARVVRLTGDLVDNPIAAIQEHQNLTGAARVLAKYAAAIAVHRPVFWRDDVELRTVDEVFVRTMKAAGQPAASEVSEHLEGETLVYSVVWRVGRSAEMGRLQARVQLDGTPRDVDVRDDLAELVWDVAKRGEIVPLRIRGRWVEAGEAGLRLHQPEIVGLDAHFAYAPGGELMAEMRSHPDLFSADDFERMLADLQPGWEDETCH